MKSRLFSSVAAAAFAVGLTAGGAMAQDEQIPKHRQMQQGETTAPRQEPANKMEVPKQKVGEQNRPQNDAGQQPMQAQQPDAPKKRPAESADTATPAKRQQQQADQSQCPPGQADCPTSKQRTGEQQPATGLKPKANTAEETNTLQRKKVGQQPEDQNKRQQLGQQPEDQKKRQQLGQQPEDKNKRQQIGQQPDNGGNNNRIQTGEAQGNSRTDVSVTGSLNVSKDKASRVRERLFRTGERTDVDVNVNVEIGTALPARVRPRPLPSDIVEIVPEYRGYDYVIVQDEVVIVEPQTRKVVEVIRQGGGRQQAMTTHSASRIRLSVQQRQQILDYARQRNVVTVQRTIEEGASVPSDIELVPLPDTVISEVPDIRSYQFFVAGDNEIVLVDPSSHSVVDVIQ